MHHLQFNTIIRKQTMDTQISFQSSPFPGTLNMTFRNTNFWDRNVGWLEVKIDIAMRCLAANDSIRVDLKRRKLTTRGNWIGMGKEILAAWNYSGHDIIDLAVRSPEVAYSLMRQYKQTDESAVYDEGSISLFEDYVREYAHQQMEQDLENP